MIHARHKKCVNDNVAEKNVKRCFPKNLQNRSSAGERQRLAKWLLNLRFISRREIFLVIGALNAVMSRGVIGSQIMDKKTLAVM